MNHSPLPPNAGHLLPHPKETPPPVAVQVTWAWQAGDLVLHYRVTGDWALRWPGLQAPGPADGLWRHSCFEAFVGTPDAPRYHEYNFSPSTRWARYRFRAQRLRDADAEASADAVNLLIRSEAQPGDWRLSARVPASDFPTGAAWTLGLSAVLEDSHGHLSHWALAHPGTKPDFHHPGGRVWRLPRP